MTNLLIGTNSIMLGGGIGASSEASGYAVENLKTGARWSFWKAGTAAASQQVTYQGGSGFAGVNYCFLARADLCVKDDSDCSFLVETSPSGAWSTWWDSGDLTASDLHGPNSEDLIYYSATASAAASTYVRLNIKYGAAGTPQLSKWYTGLALDLGRDPTSLSINKRRPSYSAHHSRHEIRLGYEDIAHSAALELLAAIAEIGDYHPVVLFTTTNHTVLNNWRCIHVKLTDCTVPQEITNRNNIDLNFVELI